MPNTVKDLADALAEVVLGRHSEAELTRATAALIERYQARTAAEPSLPILQGSRDVAAYALYRMPATYAAIGAALEQAARSLPDFVPRSQLDIGSGTGAALWAADRVWGGIDHRWAYEGVREAAELGRDLAVLGGGALAATEWIAGDLRQADDLPAADLGTAGYVLGELGPEAQLQLVDALVTACTVVAIVEPGTTYGFANVLRARGRLLEAGWTVAAPCPHDRACPLDGSGNWCHFAERLPRGGSHRRLKGAVLSYEDEKFSYVVASRSPARPVANRILRHPLYRKGLVSLEVCVGEESATRIQVVTKRQGTLYRAARDVRWGEAWPPDPSTD